MTLTDEVWKAALRAAVKKWGEEEASHWAKVSHSTVSRWLLGISKPRPRNQDRAFEAWIREGLDVPGYLSSPPAPVPVLTTGPDTSTGEENVQYRHDLIRMAELIARFTALAKRPRELHGVLDLMDAAFRFESTVKGGDSGATTKSAEAG